MQYVIHLGSILEEVGGCGWVVHLFGSDPPPPPPREGAYGKDLSAGVTAAVVFESPN